MLNKNAKTKHYISGRHNFSALFGTIFAGEIKWKLSKLTMSWSIILMNLMFIKVLYKININNHADIQ